MKPSNLLVLEPLKPAPCPHCLGTGRLMQVTTIKLGGADLTVVYDPQEPNWRIGEPRK